MGEVILNLSFEDMRDLVYKNGKVFDFRVNETQMHTTKIQETHRRAAVTRTACKDIAYIFGLAYANSPRQVERPAAFWTLIEVPGTKTGPKTPRLH